jgi:hypothetical protein
MLNMDLFSLRRAIERLRDGLFDPVAVKRLTMEQDQVKKSFSAGLAALEKEKSDHLCICGSYGQGKSHTLAHLNQYALSQGYATSLVQLDIREVPFHQFSVVYHSLMEKLSLPDGEKFIAAWKKKGGKDSLDLLNEMPHRFQMILTAMLCNSKPISPKQKVAKKEKNSLPKEFPYWLEKALMGHDLPVTHLKSILKHREIEGYQKQSLICRGNLPYVQMVQALGKLLKEMGYKGLIVFFDEAESITQGRLGNRVKSYEILDQFFQARGSVYPIFALTDDFFDKVNHEEYDDEKQTFSQNYAKIWENLKIVRLQVLSTEEWETLQNRLIQLYADAYQIDFFEQMMGIKEKLQNLFDKLKAQETRFILKALVNQLDIEAQALFTSWGRKPTQDLNKAETECYLVHS